MKPYAATEGGVRLALRLTPRASRNGVDGVVAGIALRDFIDAAPFGEARAKLVILDKSLAQAVQAFGDGFVRPRHVHVHPLPLFASLARDDLETQAALASGVSIGAPPDPFCRRLKVSAILMSPRAARARTRRECSTAGGSPRTRQ